MKLIKKKDQINSESENFKVYDVIPFNMDKIERVEMWDPHFELIETAYNKISKLWNESQKSRNFIKHLAAAHLPIQQFDRAFNVSDEQKDKFVCCILGDKLTGIKNSSEALSKLGMTKMMISAHLITEKREATQEEIDKLESERNSIPKEILDCRIGYISEKSDKYLSQEAILALRHFVIQMMMVSEELENIFSRKRQNESKALKPKDVKINKPNPYGVKNHIDQSTIDQLSALKEKMESETNKA